MNVKNTLLLIFSTLPLFSNGQVQHVNHSIISGIPWFDDKGNIVSAHGANIIKDNGKYFLFGEFKSDTSNAFNGFSPT